MMDINNLLGNPYKRPDDMEEDGCWQDDDYDPSFYWDEDFIKWIRWERGDC